MVRLNLCLTFLFISQLIWAQQPTNMKPEDTEFYEPKLRAVRIFNEIPDDAVVLFDGKDLGEWVSQKDSSLNAPWSIKNDVLVVKPGSGNIETKRKFEDFQLHLEWRSPDKIKGDGQGRGNSGVFLQGLYEIQILDNQDNPTYVNGQAGSLYKQHPPLVEVRADAEGWHSYDIIYTAPKYNRDNQRIAKGQLTLLHNGVVIQNNTQIEGTTEYIGLPQVIAHGKGSIALQDHGDLVSFRNIWIREL